MVVFGHSLSSYTFFPIRNAYHLNILTDYCKDSCFLLLYWLSTVCSFVTVNSVHSVHNIPHRLLHTCLSEGCREPPNSANSHMDKLSSGIIHLISAFAMDKHATHTHATQEYSNYLSLSDGRLYF